MFYRNDNSEGNYSIEVFSIHFGYQGSNAILLRDPKTDEFISSSPEWILDNRNEPAAYVQKSRVKIKVVFRVVGTPPAKSISYLIGAKGNILDIDERRVKFKVNPISHLSPPVVFRLKDRLPSGIRINKLSFDWYSTDDAGDCVPIGKSDHRICTTWKAMSINPDEPTDELYNWAYKPLMTWSCEWAAGQRNKKGICDAHIRNLHLSGLKYGVEGWSIEEMFLKGGGMCGGWYLLFQHLAHCQGVYIHRRFFLVDWRELQRNKVQWNAIVVSSGGLNQPSPTADAREFFDNVDQHPILKPVEIRTVTERRYRFFGNPLGFGDGHAINFLVYNGRLYLYDPSHGIGPLKINIPLPPNNLSKLGGNEIASFKETYLDHRVDFMMGSLANGDIFFQASVERNGMSVQTSIIPHTTEGFLEITFSWGA